MDSGVDDGSERKRDSGKKGTPGIFANVPTA